MEAEVQITVDLSASLRVRLIRLMASMGYDFSVQVLYYEGRKMKLVLVGKRTYNSGQQPINRNLKRGNRLQKNPGFRRKHHLLLYALNKNQIQ